MLKVMKLLVALLFLTASLASGGELKQQEIDLEKLREGELPQEIFVIDGSIRIKFRQGRKVIEISGDKPEVDAGAVLGPISIGAAKIEARVFASKAGRSLPRFGVGVHGQTGFRLFVVPARMQLQLMKGDEVITAVPFEWKSETAVQLRLAYIPASAGHWTVTGKAWIDGTQEPAVAQITQEISSPPPRGQSSIWATPYAGTPVDFDQIKVSVDG
jgi:hypothetical protein